MVEEIFTALRHPFEIFFDPSQRLSIFHMAAALAFAIFVFYQSRKSLKGLIKWLLPWDILTHKSAKADYVMFFVNKSLIVAIYASVLFQVTFWYNAVEDIMGPAKVGQYESSWTVSLIYTLATVLAVDGALWLAHTLFHRIPFLWEFHKVHHSAEVMTPLTATRMHPLEEAISMTMSGFAVGVVAALLDQYFGTGARVFTLFGLNVVTFMFFVVAFNLRHSHVWLQYPNWIQHIFVSPAQHQIHHSKARRHWDKNMGFIFAFWDWAAGSLYSPKTNENVEFGLGNGEDGTWNNPVTLYFRPFKNAYELFKKDPRGALTRTPAKSKAKQAVAPESSAETN